MSLHVSCYSKSRMPCASDRPHAVYLSWHMLYPFCLEDARLLSGDGSIRVHKEMVGVRKLYGGLRMLEWPGGREFNKLQLSFRSTIQY
jgi:hypothetical protein